MTTFNSIYSGHKVPTYPLGDPVKYPQPDIPLGTLKLYTEQYISNIGQGIQTVLDSDSQYTTQEMSTALATAQGYIHDCSTAINTKIPDIGEVSLPNMSAAIASIPQGANDVWIGSQLSYNQLGTYIDTTAYIIFENNHILKVYAGDIPIYVEPIAWDYVLMNESITANRVIDTHLEVQGSNAVALGWEYIFHISHVQSLFNNANTLVNCCAGAGPQRISTEAGGTWLISLSFWEEIYLSYPTTENPYLYYRAHKDPGSNLIYIYQRDLEDNETFINSYTMDRAVGRGDTVQIGVSSGWGQSIFYLDTFKFRWIT